MGPEIAGATQRAALGSLGQLAQSPIVRAAIRYWWISVPVGFAAWRSWQKRKAQGASVNTVVDVVTDIAPLVAAIGTVVMINETLRAAEARQQAAAAPAAPKMQARDAEFTLRKQPASQPAGA